MKKIIFVLIAAFTLTTIGCKSGPSSSDPRATLLSFFQALAKKDMKEARKYTTKESESMLSMMEMGMQMAAKMKNKEADDEFSKFNEQNVEIGEPKIDGDKALVPIKNKKDGESTNMVLKKEDGAWKVAFDKATMTEMAGEKMREKGETMPNMDSLTQAIQNINTDSLKEVMKKGIGAIDSVKDAMKDLKK
jgi:Domain of unknown function (DUF4878)